MTALIAEVTGNITWAGAFVGIGLAIVGYGLNYFGKKGN
jgi:hypothetical protein